MKKISLLLLGIVLIFSAKAQVNNPEGTGTSKAVYAELGGGGIIFSANFDSRFKGSHGLGFRAGIGFLPATNRNVLTFPLGINYLVGNGASHFEAEVTVTPMTAKATFHKRTSSIFISPHIGYRYTKPSNSFNFRIYGGLLTISGDVIPWGGLSFGYTLKNKR